MSHLPLLTRRELLGASLALGALGAVSRQSQAAPPENVPRDDTPQNGAAAALAPDATPDVPIDATTAQLFPAQSPLTPAPGLRDARAVWSRVSPRYDGSVLLYLHGHNNYVTVDERGRSRVPDWATTPAARAGAASKLAAPLSYGLDRLESRPRPLILVPEVGALTTGVFWGREPAGQFSAPAQLGALVRDCTAHLSRLRRPAGKTYLSARQARAKPTRVYLAGHSGAGLPLEEAAVSSLVLPPSGAPTDLWLLDCTYWSKIAGFVEFCRAWHQVGRLGGAKTDAARLVCIYRPGTQTQAVADELRAAIAAVLGVPAPTLLQNHSKDNFETQIRPRLQSAGATFIATDLSHEEIPTFFIPALLDSAAI